MSRRLLARARLVDFMRRHGLFLHGDALWRRNPRLLVSTVVWPPRQAAPPRRVANFFCARMGQER